MRAPALLLALLFLSACAPEPPDPLDWRIAAGTPNEFNAWCAQHQPRMGAQVHADFANAIKCLAAKSARFGQAYDMRETNNPLCQRVNQLTVRSVIIDGLTAGRDILAAQLALKQENVLRTVQAGLDPSLTSAQQAAYERRRIYTDEVVAELKRRVAETEERIHLYESGGDPDLLPPPETNTLARS